MKKLLFLGACLVALASQPARAQAGGADVVVVRVQETAGRFVIARPGGKTEEVSFNWKLTNQGLAESSVQLQQAVTSLYQQGYTFGSGSSSVSTLIFVKEK
jgi:hypothetical protein